MIFRELLVNGKAYLLINLQKEAWQASNLISGI